MAMTEDPVIASVGLKLTAKEYELLAARARKEGRPVAAMARQLIRQALETAEPMSDTDFFAALEKQNERLARMEAALKESGFDWEVNPAEEPSDFEVDVAPPKPPVKSKKRT